MEFGKPTTQENNVRNYKFSLLGQMTWGDVIFRQNESAKWRFGKIMKPQIVFVSQKCEKLEINFKPLSLKPSYFSKLLA